VGIIIAVIGRLLLKKLPAHPAGSALILLIPFAAYAAADAAHGSGVLAVVTVALALDRYGDAESSQTRLVAGTTWEIIELLVTGAAFAFVGLELRAVANEADGQLDTMIGQAAIVTAVVIVVRFLWIFPAATIDEKIRRRRNNDLAEPVGWREMTVASWAGMRGVVTLVAALALPQNFPERDRLIFIAFVVISVTLLLQGLTLPWLVRRLDVSGSDEERHRAEQELIRRARDAGFDRLDELREREDADGDVIEQARENADRMWHSLGYAPNGSDDGARRASDRAGDAVTVNAVKDEMLAAARNAVVQSRTQSGTDPTIADRVLRRLDARGSQPE
jgi:CPA1 family monovalent cation:H+ antiporter